MASPSVLGRAELHEACARVLDRDMARRHVVGVAGRVGLGALADAELHGALDDVPEAEELALVVGEALEERTKVLVVRVGLEADGVAAVEVGRA